MKSLIWGIFLVCLGFFSSIQAKHSVICLDCHILKISPSKSNTTLVDCSKTTLPYCDSTTASCSANPSPACVNPDNFTCLSDGYFPDPWNCQSFHLCVNLEPTRYFCDSTDPTWYNFDVILHRCTQTALCDYACTGKSGVKVAHPDDGNLFAYCYNGMVILQDRCPGNYELIESSQRCEAVCKAQGLLVDVEKCNMYYRCIYQNSGYYRSHEQCPEGQGFNPLTLQCEDGLPYCTIGTYDLPALYRSPLLLPTSL